MKDAYLHYCLCNINSFNYFLKPMRVSFVFKLVGREFNNEGPFTKKLLCTMEFESCNILGSLTFRVSYEWVSLLGVRY